jgi:hypothetical protein
LKPIQKEWIAWNLEREGKMMQDLYDKQLGKGGGGIANSSDAAARGMTPE